ncbi:UDP-4-amino-4,6-dideoxy-N-acetyl-beta-L-altrosamine transaminase [Marinobacter sp. LV10MA510-1]|uniref:UDP-4-amino-4, 6-dideoxy-N-acetyl-beta-L-altrosamine transaminase n=1 Tax=Marinobacter sp. LV10MA510-1 TaxID=1415567 RepID=UPI000BFA6B08|nr:UDP-4-amino-4,6-dideoxy-N-acetyl-beta-L-altrosamine transaminase [Marinobacter sp. LV10MA510-1]PFG11725.1 UDP-4-amino-4,6-dideoxy-N-acetyl-beta-L-altrosamine transaminase [Marinobacter sp. LV10MA510-1]
MIPYGKQDISKADIDAVLEVLSSDFLTQGPKVPEFERSVAGYAGAKYGIAVNSATSALHVACKVLDLGPGDWFWTTPVTFVASANCGLYCGARVDFVDIDPITWNLCPRALESKLRKAEVEGRVPKVLVVVHFCGQPCDMSAIQDLSQRYGFRIIEDASHAIGGKYRSEFIGGGSFSDITVFSFHPVKNITTAEGGMALTNCDVLARRMRMLIGHGITRDLDVMTHEPDGPWYYQQVELGFNYRMTELQAALGISQMSRLASFIARRHEIARHYDSLLDGFPVITPWQHPDDYSGMHLYVIRVRLDTISRTHRQVFESMRQQGVGVQLHYIPVHTQPYYRAMGFEPEDFPEAMNYYREAISLPIFPGLTDVQQSQVIDSLRQALGSRV